jgi:hypothetical protein
MSQWKQWDAALQDWDGALQYFVDHIERLSSVGHYFDDPFNHWQKNWKGEKCFRACLLVV